MPACTKGYLVPKREVMRSPNADESADGGGEGRPFTQRMRASIHLRFPYELSADSRQTRLELLAGT
jgi:hypothetical protein